VAGDRVVEVDVRLAAVVLPVVRVDAEGFVVPREIIRAPHRLVVEHIEVRIKRVVVNQLDLDVLLRVRKRAVLPILALVGSVGVVAAELGLVFVGLVELLDAVMREAASTPVVALLVVLNELAHVVLEEVAAANLVLGVVVVGALLVVVGGLVAAEVLFEEG
jgi:hypothetical protein